ncbi:hypothetical protein ACJZ2D_014943 [Fusarium nematophilum]
MKTLRLLLSFSFIVAILAQDGHRTTPNVALSSNPRESGTSRGLEARDVDLTRSSISIQCYPPRPPITESLFDYFAKQFCLDFEKTGLTKEKPFHFQRTYNMSGISQAFAIRRKFLCQKKWDNLDVRKESCRNDLDDIWRYCQDLRTKEIPS